MGNENSSYSISGRFTGQDKIVAAFLGIGDASDRVTKRIVDNNKKSSNAWKQHSSAVGGFVGNLHKMDRFLSGYRIINVGGIFRDLRESAKPFIDEALKLSQAQAKFRAINLPEIENQRAFSAIADTVKNIKGLKLTEVTETMTDLHTATGSLTHALEGLAVASKFRFAFSTMMGDKFSPEQIEASIQKGFKFLELTGVMQQGEKAVEEHFNAMVQMMAATGGRVTPDMLLLMAQRGGPATRSLSIGGMRNLSAPIQELGAPRAGTALMSLYSQLVGGRGGGQPSMMEFMRLGLLPKGGVEYTKAGMPKRIKPGAFGQFALAMQEDPLKAADMLVRAMAKPQKGKAVEGAELLVEAIRTGETLPAEKLRGVRQELAVLFANRMANSLMDILVTQRPQVQKETGLAEAAKNIQQLYDQALESPAGKIKQFENAVSNLEATVGGPMLNAFTKVLDQMRPFIDIMAQHPQLTLFTLAGWKLIGMLGELAIAARMSGVASLFGAGAGAGAGLAGKAAAGGAGAVAAGGARAEFEALFGGGAGAAGAAGGAGAAAGIGRAAGIAKGVGWSFVIISVLEQVMENYTRGVAAGAVSMDAGKLRTLRDELIDTMFKSIRESGRAPAGVQDKIADLDRQVGKKLSEDPNKWRNLLYPYGKGLLTPVSSPSDPQIKILLRSLGLKGPAQAEGYIAGLKERGEVSAETMSQIERLAKELWPSLGTETKSLADSASAAVEAIKLLKLELLGLKAPPSSFDEILHPPTSPHARKPFSLERPSQGFGFFPKLSSYSPPSYEPQVGLMPAMMQAATAGGGPVEVHVHQNVSGDADPQSLERIKHATKQAVRESSREIRKSIDERTRQRERMI